ncbi:hypothetical protein CcCBS67573_g00309 [Chytriomyces confervae]|uniref:Uncharacterized protein n=1 Tax=Chytriomyces confervae TaxID=246404 RepID=A0A507FPR7_9FUNG|nr:hypothetical protein HDU80_009681 [Chytriomyces hyalinus]TPX78421.1 hypothetical protein CcCBS67573_g00309 [Chytriomyces confervae]
MELCHNGDALTVTKFYALGWDAQEDHYLSNCLLIEISTEQQARTRGHCSDFVRYIYYADARLIPYFSAETYKRKMERCPNSNHLHGEEQIKKEQSWLIRASHMIACKVHAMGSSIETYLADSETQQLHLASKVDNERLCANATPILRFMSHSSPDASSKETMSALMPDRFNKFYHAFGHSGR